MKELTEAIGLRVRAPFFGFFLLGFIAVNWRSLFVLLISGDPPVDRIDRFDEQTSIFGLIVWPTLFATAYLILLPWLKYVYKLICAYPDHLLEVKKTQLSHKQIDMKIDLEKARNQYATLQEQSHKGSVSKDALQQYWKPDIQLEHVKRLNELRHMKDVGEVKKLLGQARSGLTLQESKASSHRNAKAWDHFLKIANSHEFISACYRALDQNEEAEDHLLKAAKHRQYYNTEVDKNDFT